MPSIRAWAWSVSRVADFTSFDDNRYAKYTSKSVSCISITIYPCIVTSQYTFSCSSWCQEWCWQVDHCKCPWCNGYRRRKWTRRHQFKSWTRLIAFHIVLIPLRKVWIQLLVGQTGFFSLGEATSLGKGKLWIQTC